MSFGSSNLGGENSLGHLFSSCICRQVQCGVLPCFTLQVRFDLKRFVLESAQRTMGVLISRYDLDRSGITIDLQMLLNENVARVKLFVRCPYDLL